MIESEQVSPTLSIVVPCHDEEAALEPYLKATASVLDGYGSAHEGFTYEIVFIDDGSTDGTLQRMRALAAKMPSVKYVSLSRNFGKESAMYAGLSAAHGQLVAIMDVDLQDPPDMLPKLIDAVRSGACNVARVRRVSRDGEPMIRSWFARSF